MKKNFKWLINVAAICLCVCAMAIGIYAAKNASLTATGTIGFTAHDCNVLVSGTIVGHATTADGEATTTAVALKATDGTSTEVSLSNSKDTLNIGQIYFSDMATGTPTEIVIKLNITNKSAFQVAATILVDDMENIMYSRSHTVAQILEKDGTDGNTLEFTITLNVLNANKNIASTTPININTYFTKYTKPTEAVSIEGLTYTPNSGGTAWSVRATSATDMVYDLSGDVEILSLVNGLPVTIIAYEAFGNPVASCTGITSISIPNSVTAISTYVFYGCSGLTSLDLPDSLNSVDSDCGLGGMANVTSIVIPYSVTDLKGSYNNMLFQGSSYTSITFESPIVPTFSTSIFGGLDSSCDIYVPAESLEVYVEAFGSLISSDRIKPIAD